MKNAVLAFILSAAAAQTAFAVDRCQQASGNAADTKTIVAFVPVNITAIAERLAAVKHDRIDVARHVFESNVLHFTQSDLRALEQLVLRSIRETSVSSPDFFTYLSPSDRMKADALLVEIRYLAEEGRAFNIEGAQITARIEAVSLELTGQSPTDKLHLLDRFRRENGPRLSLAERVILYKLAFLIPEQPHGVGYATVHFNQQRKELLAQLLRLIGI